MSTPLPALDTLRCPYVSSASTPEDFVAAVRSRLDEPLTHDSMTARRDFAAGHTWDARAADLLAALNGLPRPAQESR